jgi:hypothetical protein
MPSWVPDRTIPTKDLPLAELTKIVSYFTLDTGIGIGGPCPTDTVPSFVDDMLDNLVHQLLRQYHSRIPSPDSDYAEPLTEREGVGLVQWDGDTFHVPTVLMGLGRRDAIRTLGLDASTST